jgi:hypothetical protein
VLSLLLLPLALGCASQGPLKPPSLNLPAQAEKLTAARVGDHVELAWNTPATTTDGVKIKGAISANVCLDSQPSTTAPPAAAATKKTTKRVAKAAPPASAGTAPATTSCNAVQHMNLTAGPSTATAVLGSALAAGAPRLVAYRIELLNAKGRSAGPSGAAFVVAGAGLAAVGVLTVSAERESAVVAWKPEPGDAVVELKRTLVATAAGPVEAKPAVKEAKAPAPFTPIAKEPPREVVLRPDGEAHDAGGMMDRSVRDGDTYTYVAQRVETLTLAGHPLEMRSVASPPATFTYHDVFPPRAPIGLVSVPGGGFGEAPSIDLSWDANIEADVAGYNVYRNDGAGFARVNAELVATPAYADVHVEAGRQYTYRVTAVDLRKNESAPSATVTESLRK